MTYHVPLPLDKKIHSVASITSEPTVTPPNQTTIAAEPWYRGAYDAAAIVITATTSQSQSCPQPLGLHNKSPSVCCAKTNENLHVFFVGLAKFWVSQSLAVLVGDSLGFSLGLWCKLWLRHPTQFMLIAGLLYIYKSVSAPATVAIGHKDSTPTWYMLGLTKGGSIWWFTWFLML